MFQRAQYLPLPLLIAIFHKLELLYFTGINIIASRAERHIVEPRRRHHPLDATTTHYIDFLLFTYIHYI